MTRPVHALVLGLSLSLIGAASAATMESKGSPDTSVSAMSTYGLDVPTRTGLKSVVPAGWQLFIHRSVTLPDTMSWKLGDAWPSVLTDFASSSKVAVLIDWDSRVVMMRSPEQALEERAKREEIEQAALTPLPAFDDALSKVEQAKAEARAAALAQAEREKEAVAKARAQVQLAQVETGSMAPASAPKASGAEAAQPEPVLATQAKSATSAGEGGAQVVASLSDPAAPVEPATGKPIAPGASESANAKPLGASLDAKPDAVVAQAATGAPAAPSGAMTVASNTPGDVAQQPSAKQTVVSLSSAAWTAPAADSPSTLSMNEMGLRDTQQQRADATPAPAAVALAAGAGGSAPKAPVFTIAPNIEMKVSAPAAAGSELAAAPAPQAEPAVPGAAAATVIAAMQSSQATQPTMPAPAGNARAAAVGAVAPAASAEANITVLAPSQSSAAVPVIRTNPTPEMVSAQAEAARRAPARAPVSTDEFRYTAAAALNKPNARTAAQAIANRFNLRLVYASPEYQLKGPVTLLAQSAEQDAQLLQKAIGINGPLVLEVSQAEKVLRVLPRYGAPLTTAAAGSTNSAGVGSSYDAMALGSARGTPSLTPNAAVSAEVVNPAPLTLVLNAEQPLEDVLVRFTRAQGYTLEWKVEGGFEANRAMQFSGTSVAQVLSQVLPNLGLSADIYTRDKHIVVRPGDAALDR